MTWPTDDLTVAELDEGGDDPSLARAELLAAVNKIKSILGEVTAGQTVWHGGNDGAGSGLDADLLDGQQGSFYQNAGNLNAGTVPLARLPSGAGNSFDADLLDGQQGSYYLELLNATGSVQNSQIGFLAVSQDKIQSNSIDQARLQTATGEVSVTGISGNFTLPGGQYGFYPQTRTSVTSNLSCEIYDGGSGSPTTYTTTVHLASAVTAYAQQRYVQSSPPYKIGVIDFPLFVYVLIGSNGKIKAIANSPDPTWWLDNPTPNDFDDQGNKYLRRRVIPPEIAALKKTDMKAFLQERRKIKKSRVKITTQMKNRTMNQRPHPFLSKEPGDTVCLLSPSESEFSEFTELKEDGESVNELFENDYVRVTAATDAESPNGVKIHKFKFKNTR